MLKKRRGDIKIGKRKIEATKFTNDTVVLAGSERDMNRQQNAGINQHSRQGI